MEIVAEQWRAVEGYEGRYEVSSEGRVRGLDRMIRSKAGSMRLLRGVVIRLATNRCGYQQVYLGSNGSAKYFSVHRLVAKAFLRVDADGLEVNHKNGIKTDNRVENLEWVTRSENARHALENRLRIPPNGSSHHASKMTEDKVLEVRRRYASGSATRPALAREYNISARTIDRIIDRTGWRHLPPAT